MAKTSSILRILFSIFKEGIKKWQICLVCKSAGVHLLAGPSAAFPHCKTPQVSPNSFLWPSFLWYPITEAEKIIPSVLVEEQIKCLCPRSLEADQSVLPKRP